MMTDRDRGCLVTLVWVGVFLGVFACGEYDAEIGQGKGIPESSGTVSDTFGQLEFQTLTSKKVSITLQRGRDGQIIAISVHLSGIANVCVSLAGN